MVVVTPFSGHKFFHTGGKDNNNRHNSKDSNSRENNKNSSYRNHKTRKDPTTGKKATRTTSAYKSRTSSNADDNNNGPLQILGERGLLAFLDSFYLWSYN